MHRFAESKLDPSLVEAWLRTRSIARGLPLPVADYGGWRVDTASEKEIQRWVFTRLVDGLSTLAEEIAEPGYFLKLCGPADKLIAVVPARWKIQPIGYVMTIPTPWRCSVAAPPPYRVKIERHSAITKVTVIASDGSLAASGYAAETADVFIYDRIVSDPAHRRRGLARCVMATLAAEKKSDATPEMLVASEDGRKLYASLGWRVYSPYSTVTIPLAREP